MSNNLDYVNYDFDDLVVQLINRLSQGDAWKDTYRSATGEMLIELLAYVGNLVLYYIERRAEESYIATAKNRSSVVNLVKLLNYNPKRKVSSIPGPKTSPVPKMPRRPALKAGLQQFVLPSRKKTLWSCRIWFAARSPSQPAR